MPKKKGYIMLTTLIFTFVLMVTTAAIFTVSYRYVNIVTDDINDLRKEVYDNEVTVMEVLKDDSNWFDI